VAVPFGLFAYVLDDQVGIAVFEAVFATAMIIGLLVLFRERFAGGWPSFLTANAFAVYVLHAIVITALGIALSGLVAPAIVKARVLGALGLPLCWTFAAAVRARCRESRRCCEPPPTGSADPLTGRGATRPPTGRRGRTRRGASTVDTLRCRRRPEGGGRGPRPGDRSRRTHDVASARSTCPRARSRAPSAHCPRRSSATPRSRTVTDIRMSRRAGETSPGAAEVPSIG
jgi:hypothetical protein